MLDLTLVQEPEKELDMENILLQLQQLNMDSVLEKEKVQVLDLTLVQELEKELDLDNILQLLQQLLLNMDSVPEKEKVLEKDKLLI